MASEQYTTLGATTLSSGYTAGSGSMVVTSAASLPASGLFSIVAGALGVVYTVSAVSGTTLTVAVENGTDANLSAGAAITEVLTARSLDQLRKDFIQSDTIANRPAAPKTGTLYVPTDAELIQRYNGSSWDSIYSPKIYDPVAALSGFATINATPGGGATVTSSSATGVITLSVTTSGSSGPITALVIAVPATPYKIWTRMFLDLDPNDNNAFGGLAFFDGNGNSALCQGWLIRRSGISDVYDMGPSNSPTFPTARYQPSIPLIGATIGTLGVTIGLEDDGTNKKFVSCPDIGTIGASAVVSLARATYFTPAYIGVYLRTNNQPMPYSLRLVSWRQQ